MMDKLVVLDEQLVNGHLAEPAIEAFAGDREDLLHDDARAHMASCAACATRVSAARTDREAVSAALRVEIPESVLASLVESALAEVAPMSARPAPRSLALAATLGSLTAATLGALSLERLPSIGGLEALAHRALSLVALSDRLVERGVPGGWGTLAILLSLVLLSVVAPLRALVALPSTNVALRVGALMLFSLGSLSFGGRARALDFEGTWPTDEKITVVADDVPASVALERAAQNAGLGFVGVLAVDPTTHLRVRDATLRDVIVAVLGPDAPFVVERTPSLLIVRAVSVRAAPIAAPTVVSAPPVTPPVAAPSPAVPSGGSPQRTGDRVTFGDDVVVRAGESVETVMTFGGDATIGGEVRGDVVTMGGDVYLQPGSIVYGEIVTFGGELHDARVGRPSPRERARHDAEEAAAEWVSKTFESGASHALLFLLGLLLLGLAPTRLESIARTLTTRPGRAAAVGALAGFASIVLAIILMITIIGIPAALLLALALPIATYGGVVAVAVVIGRVLPLRSVGGSPVRELAAGVIALFIVSLVPIVGGIFGLVAACIGLGAVVLTRAGTQQEQEALVA